MKELQVIDLKRGEISRFAFELADEDGPTNLTGGVFYLTAKRHLGDGDEDAVLDLRQADHDDAEAGQSHFQIDLTEVPVGRYITDVWFKDSLGHPVAFPTFVLNVTHGVTGSTAD